jgi:hypothetical protein
MRIYCVVDRRVQLTMESSVGFCRQTRFTARSLDDDESVLKSFHQLLVVLRKPLGRLGQLLDVENMSAALGDIEAGIRMVRAEGLVLVQETPKGQPAVVTLHL